MSPEITAKIQTIDAKLTELDPVFHDFCSRYSFTFRSTVDLHPRRGVWQRQEIDRSLQLTTDLTVAEVMERGFYLEMPWSLHAYASLLPTVRPVRILLLPVFERLPYSQVPAVLAARLDDGHTLLASLTADDILLRGQVYGDAA